MTSVINTLRLEHYVETYILEKSMEFIRANRDRPFFLWAGFCGPHGPHDPPASHADLYPFEEIDLPGTLEADLAGKPAFIRRRSNPAMGSENNFRNLRRYMSYYYCLCTLIDEYVGRLIQTLEEEGLLENTLVVYTSDHGEMLGDFGMSGKGNFYEPVVRVPLLARPPGGCEGRRFNGLMEVMDVAPTFLDYAGIERPREMAATSFRSALEGGAGGHDRVLSEFTTNDRGINGKCLITARYKYVYWDAGQGGEFYDLREDPLELRNLYEDPACRIERDRHAEMLLERLMASETGYTGGRTEPY